MKCHSQNIIKLTKFYNQTDPYTDMCLITGLNNWTCWVNWFSSCGLVMTVQIWFNYLTTCFYVNVGLLSQIQSVPFNYVAILSNRLIIMPNWRQLHLEIFWLYILILFFSYLIKLGLQNKWNCQWIGTFTATLLCKLNKNVNWQNYFVNAVSE